jgi:ribosomal protein S6--L-glutamate ligase
MALQIGVVVEDRYLSQNQPSGIIAGLKEQGHQVRVIDPQKAAYDLIDDGWMRGFDLIVGRGRSYGLMCLLEWAELRGIPTINRKSAIAAVFNKADMAVTLAANSVRTPRTFLGNTQRLGQEVANEFYPLILKPIFGDNSQGLLVVNSPEEMARVEWREPVALAQTYLPTESGLDLKLYGIGDRVWAVRKASPFNKPKEGNKAASPGVVPLTPALEELGRKCGQIFRLELYGVDCIETADGPLVIEINDYPNYTGVPGANEELARYAISRATKD